MTVFSAANECRQLETSASVDDLFNGVTPGDLKEIYLTGNTFSAPAAEALGQYLSKATKLQVRFIRSSCTTDLIPMQGCMSLGCTC